MSINNYKAEMISAIEEYVSGYEKAEKVANDATSEAEAYCRKIDGTSSTAFRAEVEFKKADAKEKTEHLHRYSSREGEGFSGKINLIRGKAVNYVTEKCRANPDDVDHATMEIVKSGICSPEELRHLMNKAFESANYTMVRLIAAQAKAESEKYADSDKELSRSYMATSALANTANGWNNIRVIDDFVSVIGRIKNNPKLYRNADVVKTINDYTFGNI